MSVEDSLGIGPGPPRPPLPPAPQGPNRTSIFGALALAVPFGIAALVTMFGPCSVQEYKAAGLLSFPVAFIACSPISLILAAISRARREPNRALATTAFCIFGLLCGGALLLFLAIVK